MKLFISIDIEGIAGVTTTEHLGPKGFEYQQARKWMTETLLAAIRGAESVGVSEFVVADSHGNGLNLILDDLSEQVDVVRSWPRPLGMAEGADQGSFVGAVLLGYHTGVSGIGGGLSHTLSGNILSLSLNGQSAPECLITAAVCGHFGVPILFFSGDDTAVEQAQSVLGNIETVTTKKSLGFLSNSTITPAKSYKAIQEGVATAVKGAIDRKPTVIGGPIEMDIQLRNRIHAELLAYLPGVEHVAAQTLRIRANNILEISRWLMFIISTKDVYGGG